MNVNKTKVVLILDRSGSMYDCVEDTVGGVKSFIDEQKKLPGEVEFSLVSFNTTMNTVYDSIPINQVGDFEFIPSGGTALLDAVGTVIDSVGEKLANTKEEDRPGAVVIMIVTDGEENSSKEYKLDGIQSKIKHQQDVYKWQFSFLGADQDAFQAGFSMGLNSGDIANYSKGVTQAAFTSMSGKLGRIRNAVSRGADVTLCSAYTDDERAAMAEDSDNE